MSDEQLDVRIKMYSFIMGYGCGFITAVVLFSAIGLILEH